MTGAFAMTDEEIRRSFLRAKEQEHASENPC